MVVVPPHHHHRHHHHTCDRVKVREGAQFLGDGGGTPSGSVEDGARPMPDLSDEATRQVMPLG